VNVDFTALKNYARQGRLPQSFILSAQSPLRREEAALHVASLLQGAERDNPSSKGVFFVRPRSSGLISVEDIQEGSRTLLTTPYESGKNILIVESAESMTPEAANSLLKLLEEPPVHAVLILLTDDENELLPTVRSRCASFYLRPDPFESFLTMLRTWNPEITSEEGMFFHQNRALVRHPLPLETLRKMVGLWKGLFNKRADLAGILKVIDDFMSAGISSRHGEESLNAFRLFRALTATLCRDILLFHQGRGALLWPSLEAEYKKVDFTGRFLILLEELSEIPAKGRMNANKKFAVTEIIIKFWEEE